MKRGLLICLLILAVGGCGSTDEDSADSASAGTPFDYPADATNQDQVTAVLRYWNKVAETDDAEGWCAEVALPRATDMIDCETHFAPRFIDDYVPPADQKINIDGNEQLEATIRIPHGPGLMVKVDERWWYDPLTVY